MPNQRSTPQKRNKHSPTGLWDDELRPLTAKQKMQKLREREKQLSLEIHRLECVVADVTPIVRKVRARGGSRYTSEARHAATVMATGGRLPSVKRRSDFKRKSLELIQLAILVVLITALVCWMMQAWVF